MLDREFGKRNETLNVVLVIKKEKAVGNLNIDSGVSLGPLLKQMLK